MQKEQFDKAFKERLNGISRRNFMKFCGTVAVGMGLPASAGVEIAEAVTSPERRPTVIWLHGQECTGCTESLLRPSHPSLEHLILDLISLDYHETLSTGSGHQAEAVMKQSIKENEGKFILVIEGAIPLKDKGIYCMVGGRPFVETVRETAEKAAAIIAIGSCASWGGIQSTAPNPTGAVGAPEVLKGKTVVTIPGCPPNAYNFLSTVIHFLTFGKLPALDSKGRPKFAYGKLIHENCERRPHFDAGRFAEKFGDDGHRNGYCLYKLGCKGPKTWCNCPAILFSDAGSGAWPVGTGHPCFGCSEKGVGFNIPLHTQSDIENATPPSSHPPIIPVREEGMSKSTVAVISGAAGAAIGASAVVGKYLDNSDQGDEE